MSSCKRLICTLLVVFTVLFCAAQYQVEFARVGVNEGLSQNSVYAIHQDEQGFLWVGTGDGLNRYDGKEFLTYRAKFADTSSRYLPGRMIISHIKQDSRARLWFQTNQGLVCFDKETARFIQPSKMNHRISQWEHKADLVGIDSNNNIWLRDATAFYRLNAVSFEVEKIKPASDGVVINDAVILGNDLFYLLDDGLYSFSTHKKLPVKRKSFRTTWKKINRLTAQQIALADGNRLWLYNHSTRSEKEVNISIKTGSSLSPEFDVICEYPENVFYLRVPGKGLLRYDHKNGGQIFFKHDAVNPSSLSNNFITTSFVDRSNNLWIGTEGGGLSRLDLKPQKFKSFPAYNLNTRQAANLMVKSIFKHKEKILIGTFSQGLYVVDGTDNSFQQRWQPELVHGDGQFSINVFYTDHRGRLWMNAQHLIGILDTASIQFKPIAALRPLKGKTENDCWIYSMLEYKPDHFLLGTFAGLHRMTTVNGKIKTFQLPGDSIMNGYIQTLQKAPDGSIYVGKIGDGFRRIRVGEKNIEVLDQRFLNTGIRHFYFQKGGPIVWMASESGLIAYNSKNKSFTVYDETNGLSNSYIYSILPENDTTFWVSTNKGLNKAVVRYSGNKVQEVRFSAYTQIDGLQSNEFNTGAFFRSGDGEIFFGGVNGINWFKPDQIVANYFQPPLVLTGLSVNEKPFISETAVNYLKHVSLSSDQNTLNLRFASLEFTNPGANIYTYQLEGFDKEWIQSQKTNEARYANLPPGNYVFKVRGTNSDGVWSDRTFTLPIEIRPPFWQTIWFRVLAVLFILAGLAYSVHYYVSLRVRNKLRALEKQKAVHEERIRISRDMHDELGTGLTKIALLSEVSRQQAQAFKNEWPLQEIATTSRQLTQKMGEIIWTLNPVNDTLDNLAAYLKEQLYEMSETASIQIAFEFPPIIPSITMSNLQRQQILLITKEAFNNIVKHAQASGVIFSMNVRSESVAFSISDNGIGFDYWSKLPSLNGKKNGLNNMVWRMEQIGGTLDVISKKGEGVTISYEVPLVK